MEQEAAEGDPARANFSSNAGRTSINDSTNPSCFLSGGGKGGVMILNVGACGETISFQVNFATIVTDTDSIAVPEEGTAALGVKLSARPSGDVVVSVRRESGHQDITVQSGASLTFTTENWDQYQTVTLAAARDDDFRDDTATIRCSSPGMSDKDVAAREEDLRGEGVSWPGTSVRFYDGFESGNISSAWHAESRPVEHEPGVLQVTTNYAPHSGSYHLVMGADWSSVLQELLLSVDLEGKGDVVLDFWHKQFIPSNPADPMPASFAEHHNSGGVAISADGGNWYRVDSLDSREDTWTKHTLNLADFTVPIKLSYNSHFLIKFQWFGGLSLEESLGCGDCRSGYMFDDITVTAGKWLTLRTANGGERWRTGTTQYIQWTATSNLLGGNVRIELYKGGELYDVIAYTTPNDGNYGWAIPVSQIHGTDYRIKVRSLDDPDVYDISNLDLEIYGPEFTLTSPNGGERWQQGTTQYITWTSTGEPGPYVKLELYKTGALDRVLASSTENDGSYPWMIQLNQTPGADYKVRVISVGAPSAGDWSDDNFAIYAPGLELKSPNGGEHLQRGSTYDIAWDQTGDPGALIKLDLYKGGAFHSNIHPTVPNDGSYTWQVSSNQEPGTDYRIRIASISFPNATDQSDANFEVVAGSLIVLSPSGGERWQQGTTHNITWKSSGYPGNNVKLELYKKGVRDSTIVDSAWKNDGSYTWTIPIGQTPGRDYAVKISSVSYPGVSHMSKAFEVYAGELHLTAPNGGETWQRGTAHDIIWTSTFPSSANIKLELYRGGTFDSTIVDSTTNDGSYTWSIPESQAPGVGYLVKVSFVSAPGVSDMSDSEFKITSVTPSIPGDWWMFHRDQRHTGRSLFYGPNVPMEKWAFTTGGAVVSSPALSAYGTIYIGSYDKKVYALNPIGIKDWEFIAGGEVHSSPAIGADGTIYVGSFDGKVYALNPNGTKKWEFTTVWGVTSSPAVGTDGTIYVGMGYAIYALNPNGTEKWQFVTGDWVQSSPAIGTDGTIYIGSFDGKVYALNPNGTEKWEFATGSVVLSSPAVGGDGTVYIGSENNKVYALDPANGAKKWEFVTGGKVRSCPAIGADGTIYVGSDDNKVYALNPANGAKKWEFATGGKVQSSPAIAVDGTIYVGSDDSKVYALNPTNGTKKWEFATGGQVRSSPALDATGTLYVGSNDGKVYAITNAAPTITAITPSSGVNNASVNIADLAGTNLLSGATVKLRKSGQADIVASNVTVVSATKITCTFDLNGKATGQWDVVVVNSDGKSGTLTNGFTINYPAPTVTSITPNSGVNNASIDITSLAGTNLLSGATVKLRKSGQADIVATNVTVGSSTRITCTFDLNGKATGQWDVVVTNTDGQSGTRAGVFTVKRPPPTLTGITPNSGPNNDNLDTELIGTGFIYGPTVKLTKAGQADIVASNVTVATSTKITCRFNLSGAAIGAWDVVVTNIDGQSATLAGGFTVTMPPPKVTGITPKYGEFDGTVNVTNLAGTGFLSGASVKLSMGWAPPVVATNVTVVSPTKITCAFILFGVLPGTYDVVVTNPDGQSGTLPGGFRVTLPAPKVTGITPNYASVNTSLSSVALTGSNLLSAAAVKLRKAGQPDLSATNVTAVDVGKITCALDLTGAATGAWDVVVTNTDGQSGTLNDGFIVTGTLTTATIGTSGPISTFVPMGTSFHDLRTQVIYLASEIGAAGAITSLALDVATAPGQTLNNWSIRMKHTSMSTYPSTPVWESSGWAVVYRGNEPPGSTGWRTFNFATAFNYDGVSNLLVDFSFNNTSHTPSGSPYGKVKYTTRPGDRTIEYEANSTLGDPLNWSGTSNPTPDLYNRVPNLRLSIFPPAPTATSITPSSGTNGGTLNNVNIAGTGFLSGATAKLTKSGESDIEATGVTVVSLTAITCAFDLAGKAAGHWNVVVANTDGQSGTLPDGFTIVNAQAGTIAGVVFEDLNGNGTQDAGENGMAGVPVTLKRSDGVEIDSVATDGAGHYAFADVTAGSYTAVETDPAGYQSTTPNEVG